MCSRKSDRAAAAEVIARVAPLTAVAASVLMQPEAGKAGEAEC